MWENFSQRSQILICFFHAEKQKQKQLESKPKTDEDGQTLKRAQFLINEALEEDENGNSENAIQLYMESIDLCIKLVSSPFSTEVSCYRTETKLDFFK